MAGLAVARALALLLPLLLCSCSRPYHLQLVTWTGRLASERASTLHCASQRTDSPTVIVQVVWEPLGPALTGFGGH